MAYRAGRKSRQRNDDQEPRSSSEYSDGDEERSEGNEERLDGCCASQASTARRRGGSQRRHVSHSAAAVCTTRSPSCSCDCVGVGVGVVERGPGQSSHAHHAFRSGWLLLLVKCMSDVPTLRLTGSARIGDDPNRAPKPGADTALSWVGMPALSETVSSGPPLTDATGN